MGKLYVVGTPIGNLGDLSPRAAQVLSEVDFIAAEDTRVTMKLLSHLGIKKPMISYYEHNLREKGEIILSRLLGGESCAIVTDAGMPCISDPGEDLVAICREHGVPIEAVPGPSAAVTAVAVSGLKTSRFAFEGFLSVKKTSRFQHLESVKDDLHTLIFYEAPHKLLSTLEDMSKVLGDRQVSICRELTKLHEEVIRTTLPKAAEYYRQVTPKGEFVLVIEGAKPEEHPLSFEDALELARGLIAGGTGISQAAKEASRETGFKKGDLYKALLGE